MNVDFDCTQCGNCCHGLRLPLSVAEAIAWLDRGDEVQILCEGIPWPGDPPPDDQHAANKRRRSFAAMSGALPSRIVVTLAASFADACPHLRPDMLCGIYESRPDVCRIYPAEVNPFIALVPANKACPPQAWDAGRSPLLRGGFLVDAGLRSLVQQTRNTTQADVVAKARLCALLDIQATAMANEGFVVHSPSRDRLSHALRALSDAPLVALAPADWQFVSDSIHTVAALAEVGASSSLAAGVAHRSFEYLGFARAAEAA